MNKLTFISILPIFIFSYFSYGQKNINNDDKIKYDEYILKHQTKSSTFLASQDLPFVSGKKQKHNRNSIYRGTGNPGCKLVFQDEGGNVIKSMETLEHRFIINPKDRKSIIVVNAPKIYRSNEEVIEKIFGHSPRKTNGLHHQRPSKKNNF